MTTRLSVTTNGRRLGSFLMDGPTLRLVVAPTASEQELWDALAAVVMAVQGRERAMVETKA